MMNKNNTETAAFQKSVRSLKHTAVYGTTVEWDG